MVPRYLPRESLIKEQTDQHPDRGATKAPVPTDFFSQVSGDQRRKESSQIDAHVEEGEPGIAARVVLAIKLAHHHADAGLEKACADDDQGAADQEAHQRPVTVRFADTVPSA